MPTHTPSLWDGAHCAWRCALMCALFLTVTAGFKAQAQRDPRAQRTATQQRLEALKKQIQQDQKRLQETEERQAASQERLDEIKREIALRKELVATYERRLQQLKQERTSLKDTLQTLGRRLEDLRKEYRRRVRHAYMHSRLPDLALLLASRSINQMLVRTQYLQQFAQQRRDQRADIQRATKDLEASRQKLAAKRKRTEELLAEARTERKNLEALKADRTQMIAELRSRQSELKAAIQKKRSQAQQLEDQLQALSAKIERRSETAPTGESAARAAASAELSAAFQENRGQLPWPAQGAVTEPFGYRTGPYGTETYHPGILIATSPASDVRVVFDGVVSQVDFVPGYGTYLVVRHGEYLSVYSNLSSLYVSQGSRVSAGEVVGKAGTEDEPRGPGVFFAVFDRSKDDPVDPRTWLTPR